MPAPLCPARRVPPLLVAILLLAAAPVRAQPPSDGNEGASRLPAFAGERREDWVRVRGLFWVQGPNADAWRAGRVWTGARWVSRERAGPLDVPARDGYLIRTNHVSLKTNASWTEAEALAREAQSHVERLYATYGNALDLRFPSHPLTVIAHRSRAEYGAALRRVAPGHAGWGAFYDLARGSVHVSTEPAPAGALPWQADLRHEMTHQMLDLSSRGRRQPAANLWLWEGFAVHTETLGDGAGEDTGRLRRERFGRRRARRELTPLSVLFRMRVEHFEGRHYDQLAQLFAFLMADGVPGARQATLDSVHALLQGSASPTAFERRLGRNAAALEAAWLRRR